MKYSRFLSSLFSAILGGVFVLGGLIFWQIQVGTSAHDYVIPSDREASRSWVQPVSSHAIEEGVTYTPDFSTTRSASTSYISGFSEPALKAMPVVVHIRGEESQEVSERRRQESRDRMYGFDFFERFFEPFQKRQGSGSGVIISGDGYIVTNHHVVDYADYIEVTLNDGRRYTAIKIGSDPNSDLAVIKIDAEDLPTIPYADSDMATIGDWVLAIGNPFDYLTSTVTAGIISAKGRNLNLIKGKKTVESFIQTDAAINPGNSGGALINTDGELLGINTAIATPTGVFAGYSFAIPVKTVHRIVTSIIVNQEVIYPYFGAEITDNDKELSREFGIPNIDGAVILKLDQAGPAQFAGLYPQDLIVSIDGTPIMTSEQLSEFISATKPGDVVTLKLYRKQELLTKQLTIKKG